ncbi:MAG: hypothetical protein IPL78_03285 [Chloroflexi bacterium]|nr:hypothetical protein [Chloroflexota bacterium]
MARIDRLAGRIKDVVKVAAVLGREFEVRILSQMLQADVLPDVQEAGARANLDGPERMALSL